MRGRVACFAGLCLAATVARPVDAAAYSEDAVKAAFLHRFASYVQWPAASQRDTPFIIAVVDADGVAEQLDRLLPKIAIQGRPARVLRVSTSADLEQAQILYVGPRSASRHPELISAAAKRPILIVTDDQDGLQKGGIINFVQVGRNVRLEVSLPAADRSGLRIDSGLLAVAVHVEGRPRAGTHCDELIAAYPATCSSRLAHFSARAGVRKG
jgi:hypothetical protein